MKRLQAVTMAAITFVLVVLFHQSESAAADGRDGYHSDSNARYLHRIPLYDIDNQKITPESTRPFSSLNTCGRCHDYESIAHGWHFNAFAADMGRKSVDGRPGEPWIWTDARTGTQLPLSYRAWDHTFDPADLGLSSFEMTKQFGGRLPGGGVAADVKESSANRQATSANETSEDTVGRWALSGAMEIDCMVCHAVSGQYDFDQRREQIADENFAWAATAALRLGQVSGSVARIRDGFDPEDEAVKAKLPVVQYEGSRFGNDGTVFMDLVREPQNNACYQCHSTRMVDETGIQPRWVHDDDVHLRAGMNCVDCHRNGIDHHIVRGFDGEQHPAADATAAFTRTLSCRGCHLGSDDDNPADVSTAIHQRAGRLGAPRPLHAGLPPLHFEKLACTACHAGPIPRDEALGVLTSLAHALGEKGHRTGNELPRLVGPVFTKDQDCRVAPHKAMWPAYWGKVTDGSCSQFHQRRCMT